MKDKGIKKTIMKTEKIIPENVKQKKNIKGINK